MRHLGDEYQSEREVAGENFPFLNLSLTISKGIGTMDAVLKLLKKVGPGAIVASATIGAGETVLAVRVGAWGGYELLWLVLLAALTKSFLTLYLLGRYAAVSGEPVANRLVELPGPRGWFLWLVLLLEGMVAPFVFVVIAVPCGQLVSNILAAVGWEVSYKWLAMLLAAAAIIVGVMQSFNALEKSQMAVCLILIFGTVGATLLVRPDLWAILRGLFQVGYFPDYPAWAPAEIKSRNQLLEMASVFGYCGSIPMNYIVYSNWVLMKGWISRGTSRKRDALHADLQPLRWDVGFNAISVFVVTASFMVAGAAILKPLHRIPDGYDLLTEQALIFGRISSWMVPLYFITILAALWGTMNTLPDIYSRGAHSFLTQVAPRFKSVSYQSVARIFGVVMLPLTAIFIWTETTPIVMIDLVALFSTNIGVGLTCVAALWLDRQLAPEKRVSRWLYWPAVAAAVVINVMSLISAGAVIEKYLY